MEREFKVGTLVRVLSTDYVDRGMKVQVGMKGQVIALDEDAISEGPRCHEVKLVIPGTKLGFRTFLYEEQMEVLGYLHINQRWYFTFGTEGQVFKAGYVQIEAETLAEAQQKFIKRYGARAWKGDCLNYAFSYDEEQFQSTEQFRRGPWSHCHEVIV